jgi:hypothetical protein
MQEISANIRVGDRHVDSGAATVDSTPIDIGRQESELTHPKILNRRGDIWKEEIFSN